MSLRWKLTLALALVAAIATSAGAYGAQLATASELRETVDEFLFQRAAELREWRGDGRGRGTGGLKPGAGEAHERLDAVMQRLDGEGRPLMTLGPELPVDDADAAIAAGTGVPRVRTALVDDVSYRILTVPVRSGGAFQVGRDLTEVEAVVAGLRARLVTIGLLATLGAAMIGWLLARRTTKPIEQLRDAAQAVALTQDLSRPIPVSGSDEIASLAASFNTMLGALETSRRQQQRLVVDASHELRTPLTSLRTNIELLQRAPDMTATDRERLLDDVGLELRELSDLASELVELATDRADGGEVPRELGLDEVALTVAERARRRHGRVVTVQVDAPLTVEARAGLIERATTNLVDNAVKYSPAGTPVTIAVHGARLEVSDRGAGIPPEDLPHVFDRFYRATSARSLPGSGLGLAIVKQIVDHHGGRVWADPGPDGGAVVGFSLPTARATAGNPPG